MIGGKVHLDAFRGAFIRTTNTTSTINRDNPIPVPVGAVRWSLGRGAIRSTVRIVRGIPYCVTITITVAVGTGHGSRVKARGRRMRVRAYPRRLAFPTRLERTTRTSVRVRITTRDILYPRTRINGRDPSRDSDAKRERGDEMNVDVNFDGGVV